MKFFIPSEDVLYKLCLSINLIRSLKFSFVNNSSLGLMINLPTFEILVNNLLIITNLMISLLISKSVEILIIPYFSIKSFILLYDK